MTESQEKNFSVENLLTPERTEIILAEIQKLKQLRAEFMKLLGGEEITENFVFNNQNEVSNLIDSVLANQIVVELVNFDSHIYKTGAIGKQLKHDIGGMITFLNVAKTMKEFASDASGVFIILHQLIPVFALIGEDVFLRASKNSDEDDTFLEREIFSMEEFSLLNDFLSQICQKAQAVLKNGDVRLNALILENQTPKELHGNISVLANFLSNCVSNAARKEVGATFIDIHCSYDGEREEFVFQVQDNGTGIPHALFQSRSDMNSNRIRLFESGASESNSSGIGLGDADIRIPLYGMNMAVVTHRSNGTKESWKTPEMKDPVFPDAITGTLFEVRIGVVSNQKAIHVAA